MIVVDMMILNENISIARHPCWLGAIHIFCYTNFGIFRHPPTPCHKFKTTHPPQMCDFNRKCFSFCNNVFIMSILFKMVKMKSKNGKMASK